MEQVAGRPPVRGRGGWRRALLAVAALHAGRVAAADVPAVLQVGSWRNPYTGRAFEWDTERHCLRVGGLDRVHGAEFLPYAAASTAIGAASTLH